MINHLESGRLYQVKPGKKLYTQDGTDITASSVVLSKEHGPFIFLSYEKLTDYEPYFYHMYKFLFKGKILFTCSTSKKDTFSMLNWESEHFSSILELAE